MESPRQPGRRAFLHRLGTLTGGSVLAAQLPALLATMDLACASPPSGTAFKVLTGDLSGFAAAVAARVIPTDHRPGAAEADVVRFMDMVLDTIPLFAGADELIGSLKAQLDETGGGAFEDQAPEDQDELLRGVETGPAFGVLRFLTIAGFLVHPDRGGNRGKVGWELMGFDDRHAWPSPFGYYDEMGA